ncbi:MAG: hypothetical protein R3A79_26140 [Nannocystaceae bacterium]
MSADDDGALARRGDGWRGDEHRLQVSAADEAGLEAKDVGLELYRQGFTHGLVIRDPLDHAIVLRGRTILAEAQLRPKIRRILGHLQIPGEAYSVRVDDGDFELRISARVADAAGSSIDSMYRGLAVFLVSGLAGLFFLNSTPALTLLSWSVGLLYGASVLRRGIKQGRIRVAAHVVSELAKLAHSEQLILPPTAAVDVPALRAGDGG